MILDVLENAHRYLPLNKGFAKAMAFLSRQDLKELPAGKYEIDADRVYAMISRDHGREKKDSLLETHEKHIDIQLVLAGTDEMGWKPKFSCKRPSGEYDPETDLQFFDDEPDAWLSTKSGSFAIFFPEDAHLPMISPGHIHKVVVKVAIIPSKELL
ncbi:MAG: YhcH/YjgK/YiaL family protein [Pseudomonadota bacterium]